jgi:hypothetical protein
MAKELGTCRLDGTSRGEKRGTHDEWLLALLAPPSPRALQHVPTETRDSMLASVRSLRAAHPHRAAAAHRLAPTAVPALAAARHVARSSFSTARALRASQSPDTFMNGTNASYAQAQFEAWQEVSLVALRHPLSLTAADPTLAHTGQELGACLVARLL